jgi:hypothetical protein
MCSVITKKLDEHSNTPTACKTQLGDWLVGWRTGPLSKEIMGQLNTLASSELRDSCQLAFLGLLRRPLFKAKGLYASGNFFCDSFHRFLKFV